jgi:SAM-dependent methyltransferase
VIASTWVHDYAPKIKGLILAAPAFEIKLYVPFALPGLRLLNMIKHPMFISSYVKSKYLTHDEQQAKIYDEDELITPDIAVNILVGLFDAGKRVVEDAGAIHIPTLVLSAGKDWIVKTPPQKKFFDNLSSVHKRFITLDGFYHGVLYEKDRARAFKECDSFIQDCYQTKFEMVNLEDAHQKGHTLNEYHRLLKKPVPLIAAFIFWLTRLGMLTVGRLSKGIRIGIKSGFDSGLSLDHVYRNKAEGITPIGKLIDYFYINAVGWRGIRQRKVHMQEQLDVVINDIISRNEAVRIMDIASGPGRYLLETAKKMENHDIQVVCCDYEAKNIEAAKKIASDMNLDNANFHVLDAFQKGVYDQINFKPNVIIVSGLYELFPDNDMIKQSLKNISNLLGDNGYIIYTGQPWHPQLEMIAHTLPNRDGDKWIMRRRTQQELDQLFELCGAHKADMKIDEWGIFTVSIAKINKSKEVDRVG